MANLKSEFKEFYSYNDDEYKSIWEKGIFVFDTNFLLDLYRHSKKAVNSYFNILRNLKKKNTLRIPYQVGYEFHDNKFKVKFEKEEYEKICEELDKKEKEMLSIIEENANGNRHPFLNKEPINKIVKKNFKKIKEKIKKDKKENCIDEDYILNNINALFEIGNKYKKKKIEDIKKEGKKRYKNDVPPGHKDKDKDGDEKYGDCIIRYQILDKARETKKPIIFISNDAKEDWWLKEKGKKIMPLPELKKELLEEAGVKFHIYNTKSFVEHSKEYLNFTGDTENLSKELDNRTEELINKKRGKIDLNRNIFRNYQDLFERIIRTLSTMRRHSISHYNNEIRSLVRELILDLNERNFRSLTKKDIYENIDFIYNFHKKANELYILIDRFIDIKESTREKIKYNNEKELYIRFLEDKRRLKYLNKSLKNHYIFH